MKHAVFLTSEFPWPVEGGGQIRNSCLIRLLRERLKVEVLSFGKDPGVGVRPSDLAVTFVERERAPLLKRLAYPFRTYVINGYSERMADALRARAVPGTLLWVARLGMAQYIPLARSLGYRVILDEHNVESDLLLDSVLSAPRHWAQLPLALQCAWYERRFCNLADTVVATSARDAALLKKMAPRTPVQVIPNLVDLSSYAAIRDHVGSTLLFCGTLSYHPNVDGLRWFMREVLPHLKKPPRIVVAGANPSAELRSELEAAGIEVHANPPSMSPFLRDAAAVMVPLRLGGGTRLKILEAMAAGRAVVSTTKGAEGLGLIDGQEIVLQDDPKDFARSIALLMADPDARARIVQKARLRIEREYDWPQAQTLLDQVLGDQK